MDASGNVLVAGDFSGTANFGGTPLTSAGLTDWFVVKLSPSGARLWSTRGGKEAENTARAIALTRTGDA